MHKSYLSCHSYPPVISAMAWKSGQFDDAPSYLETSWNLVPPSDVCWFINPMNTIVISTINHSYGSYLHQLSYLGPRGPRGPHLVCLWHSYGEWFVCRWFTTWPIRHDDFPVRYLSSPEATFVFMANLHIWGWVKTYEFTIWRMDISIHKPAMLGYRMVTPSDVCWFINPMNTIVISAINHSEMGVMWTPT